MIASTPSCCSACRAKSCSSASRHGQPTPSSLRPELRGVHMADRVRDAEDVDHGDRGYPYPLGHVLNDWDGSWSSWSTPRSRAPTDSESTPKNQVPRSKMRGESIDLRLASQGATRYTRERASARSLRSGAFIRLCVQPAEGVGGGVAATRGRYPLQDQEGRKEGRGLTRG